MIHLMCRQFGESLMENAYKTCRNCHVNKPISEFYKHVAMKDGHLNKCIHCVKAREKNYRLNNLERVRAYDRARGSLPHRSAARAEYQKTEKGSDAAAKAKEAWRLRNMDRSAAQHLARRAVLSGSLIRQECFICGQEAEMHHSAYDYPLAVTWLCDKHHKQVHKEHRQYLRELNAI